eukprot:jgi/Ulvmu1/5882/UM026_0002.1
MSYLSGPAIVTQAAPHDAFNGYLMICDVVEPCMVARSNVLQCIAEAGGNASLPTAVTLSDFSVWRQAGSSKEYQHGSLCIADLCTVIKVGDVLGDTELSEWAQHFTSYVAAISSMDSAHIHDSRAEIFCGMQLLPEYLWRRICQTALQSEDAAQSFLTALPPPMQLDALQMILSKQQQLYCNLSDTSAPILAALLELPSSPPSLMSFTPQYFPTELHDSSPSRQILSLVHEVLLHHSSLVHLGFERCGTTTESAAYLAPAVANLTSLQSLSLGCIDDCCCLGTLRIWQTTLAALPQLQHLQFFAADTYDPRKRWYNNDHNPEQPNRTGVDYFLSPLTNLTSLTIGMSPHGTQAICSAAREPLTATDYLCLESLSRLHLSSSTPALWGPMLSCVYAPLTSLTLSDLNHNCLLNLKKSDGQVSQLFKSLSRYSCLQELCADVPLPANDGSVTWEAHLDTWSDALSKMTALSHLSLRASADAILAPLPRALRKAEPKPPLRRLHLDIHSNASGNPIYSDDEWDLFWYEMVETSTTNMLAELRVSVAEAWVCQASELEGMQTLPRLAPRLTSLHLIGHEYCLQYAEDVAALLDLPHLQHLTLDAMGTPASRHAELAHALLALTQLTELTLVCAFTSRFVDGFAAGVAAWPQLQLLALGVDNSSGGPEKLLRASAELPKLDKLKLYGFCEIIDMESDGSHDWDEMSTSSEEDSSVEESGLLALAEELGVKLSCSGFPTFSLGYKHHQNYPHNGGVGDS